MAGRDQSKALRSLFGSTDPAHIRCKTSTLARFTKQLSVLIGSGVPLHEALDSLTRLHTDNLSIFVIPEVSSKVTRGYRFSSALAQFPRVFPNTYTALIRASEETGSLQPVLDKLSEWLEKQDSIERHVKKALTYPVFVIVLAGILTMLLFKTVVPQILETVVALGAELPLPTKILMFIISAIESPLFWFLVVSLASLVIYYLRTPKGYLQTITILHFSPILGEILMASGNSRYSNTLSMLVESGVDIIRSCRIAAEASGNPLIVNDSIRVVKELREGRYFREALESRPFYPLMLINMVGVGDETGRMAELLGRSGALLEEETMYRLDSFVNLLEPIILAGVSLIVGSVLVAIMLPMANLVSAL